MNTKTLLKKTSITTAGALCFAFSSVEAGHAFTIDTTPGWKPPGTAITEPFGTATGPIPGTPTYGQTFTVNPGSNVLTSFSFWLGGNPVGGPVEFKAFIQKWGGSAPTDAVLYTSDLRPKSGSSVDQFTFNMPGAGLDLTAGQQYVAYLTAFNGTPGNTGTRGNTGMGYVYADVYAGGNFVFTNNGTTWDSAFPAGEDAAFQANFVVPTPAMLPGLIGMGLAAWRKRKAEAAAQSAEDA